MHGIAGHRLANDQGARMNAEGAKAKGAKPRPGGKGRDPVAAILGKRPSGKQLRETLAETLPLMKAQRKNQRKRGGPLSIPRKQD